MSASRKKKTILYGTFAAVLIFAVVQVTYFHQAYSPLQVLSDARSEARRLLRFISLYHYQCNTTLQWVNMTSWPICMERTAGLNLQNGGPRVMFSVGPTGDCTLERVLALNYSYSVNMFHHKPLAWDCVHGLKNTSNIYKSTIVSNDPADFARNSYESQTLNSVFTLLPSSIRQIDILKIEALADQSHSHEVLYYMVKDHLLARVRQLHIALYVDKVDDDYLYSWYRALYMLFNKEGFRLYHSAASDSLCLQVTLMESCIYYMSWIRDPGPQTFILYPPAIDGSESFEVERLRDYMDDTVATCSNEVEVNLPTNTRFSLCLDAVKKHPEKECHLVIFRDSKTLGSITAVPNSKCSVVTLEVELTHGDDFTFTVKHRRYQRSTMKALTLEEGLMTFLVKSSINLIYLDLPHLWEVFTQILDSGALFNVDQVVLNIERLWDDHSSLGIRKKYSELKRLESYGFRKYQINEMMSDNKLTFHSKLISHGKENNFRLNYIKPF